MKRLNATKRARWLPAALLAMSAALPLCPSPAAAQPDDTQRRAAAEALFGQATKLMDEKSYDKACPKLEEVVKLQPGKVGTMKTLAECYEATNKTASA